ncbi:eCIS core domain-containing protein [Chitinophaga rhizophila]|uniref:DUF4157 domain-containing protein n=1 Tax=Chitinophaga rhizophila TaxID=2866212 RepID=A0ABS7G859_9BACT|nr:DUF4157 domain-containing protein [Chitinophaga rhizophila]MBW8682907.1 DUF4157 domain-containing protein [Chitinophaga rhizophila]
MKTNSRRYRRHRNPENTDKQQAPFFSPVPKELPSKQDAFFQPKLAIGQPGDAYEREADAVADKVISKQPASTGALQRKEISAIQAMPEKKEEDKKVQKKDTGDRKEEDEKPKAAEQKQEEKAIQKKEDKLLKEGQQPTATDKKEDDKTVRKKGSQPVKEEEKKSVVADKKEDDKAVQKKEEPEKKPAVDELIREEKDEKEKGNKPSLMAKESNSRGMEETSDQLSRQLKQEQTNGMPLSSDVRKEMSSAIGADFRNVRVHTGEKAAALSTELGAQAFTHGNDVYFNSGKYDTESSAGKHLLAHELTHVVQQGAAPAMDSKAPATAAGHNTPGLQRDISTPLPEGIKPDEESKVAKFPVGDFKVEIKPDRKATKEENIPDNHAETKGNIATYISYEKNNKNKITKVKISKTLIIETVYGAAATASGDSAYGRGHIKADQEKGNKSLGFHEGNHGLDFMEYIKSNPFPEIEIKKPVSEAEFNTLKAAWQVQYEAYVADMIATSKKNTDDVTDPPVVTPPPAAAPAPARAPVAPPK